MWGDTVGPVVAGGEGGALSEWAYELPSHELPSFFLNVTELQLQGQTRGV